MMNVLLLARSLESGGAERQLVDLARGFDRGRFRVSLALLYGRGALLPEAEAVPGLAVVRLGKRGRPDLAGPLRRLVEVVRRERVDVVYGSLDLANLYALAGGRLGGARVVFGVRSSTMDFGPYGRGARQVWRLSALASRFADLVIYNSFAGRDFSLAHGFTPRNAAVVPNGIDLERFRPDAAGGARVRREWGVPEGAPLVGLVGRLDPMKDHATFLRAAAALGGQHAGTRFVCVGDGPAERAAQLRSLAGGLGLADRLTFAGARPDMPAVYGALDVLALSSRGEGFPNVVGEAMACAVPCVVAAVGDAARIVGAEGFVVPPGDPGALADGLRQALALSPERRRALGARCRERIAREYPLAAMVEATQRALERVVAG